MVFWGFLSLCSLPPKVRSLDGVVCVLLCVGLNPCGPMYLRQPVSTGQGTRGCLYLQAQVLEESRHGLPEVPRPVDGGMLARGLQVCAGQHVTQGNV